MQGILNGTDEMVPGHRVLDGTDLEIAYNLQGDDLILRVNKAGFLVFRVQLRDAVAEMMESRLLEFNSMAPDVSFTIGDREEGLRRMLRSAGVFEEARPAGGFFRWLTGRW